MVRYDLDPDDDDLDDSRCECACHHAEEGDDEQ
jgi:hypothetical protein